MITNNQFFFFIETIELRVCPIVQFYTKCAVIVLICAVLTASLCSYNLLKLDAT